MQVYTFRWNRCGRKGNRCIVTARGKMNSCRVEFEDGFKMITSRNALAKWKRGDWPAWGSVKTVALLPDGAHYVCGDRDWSYYISGREILAAPHPALRRTS